jgi:hypothetical protein
LGQVKVEYLTKGFTDKLPGKGWKEELKFTSEDSAQLAYTTTKGSDNFSLMINVEKTDAGIEVGAVIGKN